MEDLPFKTQIKDGLSIDVAIIGAGVSGLYTGYRILSGTFKNGNEKPLNVHIFDLNDRIGGRIQSIEMPGIEIVGELGAMRYITSQKITTSLIEDVFKLKHVTFPIGHATNQFYYLRGEHYQADAWENEQKKEKKLKTRYFLRKNNEGYSAEQLFNKIVYDVLLSDPWFISKYGDLVEKVKDYEYKFKITERQWDDIKPNLTYFCENSPYDGMKLRNLGYWNVIKDQIGQEGYNFLSDAGGYYSNTINWNAAEAFPYMVGSFSLSNVEYRTIENGYDQLAYALASEYSNFAGSQLWLKNRLITFNHNLDTENKRRYKLTLWNAKYEKTWNIYADRIILAMPRRSLELLDQENFFFNCYKSCQLQTNIASVISQPSFKLLMGFEYPWWTQSFEAKSGRSITDLPMRQCYYLGTNPIDSHSLFLASYNDMRSVTFWKSLMEKKHKNQLYGNYSTSLVSKNIIENIDLPGDPASKEMVEEAMNQVRELHFDCKNIPMPYIARVKDWSQNPYGGGYHAWRAGVASDEVMRFMRKPLEDENVHIIGEAYSTQQGWTEGAFCIAENMVQEYLGMTWPSWLDKKYYLGK
ncbi:monoamine oxidase [Bacillus thuringiensis]|nr:monoamine oxidase [Bacillus thuringiensis]